MNQKKCTKVVGWALPAWLGGASSAWAGGPIGTIDYAPLGAGGVATVPTLGEWALALMVLLLGVLAYRALRGRVNGRLMAQMLLGGGLLAGGLAGEGWLRPVEAGTAPPPPPEVQVVELTQAGGGSASVTQTGIWEVRNTSGVAQRITGLNTDGGGAWESPLPLSPECTVGLVLPAAGSCFISLDGSEGG